MKHNPEIMLIDAKDVLDSLHIPYGKINPIVVNYRAIRRWGYCIYDRITDSYTIEINPRLLDESVPYESAMNTVIHELLHSYPGRMNHTGAWKKYAKMINAEYPIYNIKRTNSSAELGVAQVENYKYKIICDGCGIVSFYQRESKVVKLIKSGSPTCRCALCHSTKFSVFTH